MSDKEQQIEEMANCKPCYQRFGKCPLEDKAGCSDYTRAVNMYEQRYRKVPNGAVILTPKERDEELKACNEKQAKLESEIEILKIQNKNLEIAFDRLEARSELFESNMKSVLEIEKKNAIKEFAERVKAKAFDKDMFNDWAGATYVVLVRDIDELLKEFTE